MAQAGKKPMTPTQRANLEKGWAKLDEIRAAGRAALGSGAGAAGSTPGAGASGPQGGGTEGSDAGGGKVTPLDYGRRRASKSASGRAAAGEHAPSGRRRADPAPQGESEGKGAAERERPSGGFLGGFRDAFS